MAEYNAKTSARYLGSWIDSLTTRIKTIDNYLERDLYFETVRSKLKSGQTIEVIENLGFSVLKYAAYTGDLNLTKSLLASNPDNPDLSRAFRLAANQRHIEVAKLLVDSGADYNFEYNNDADAGERCPFCYASINLQVMQICEHFLCTYYYEDNTIFDDIFDAFENSLSFSDEVKELSRYIKHFPEPNFLELLNETTSRLQTLFNNVRRSEIFYWTSYDQVVEMDYQVNNRWEILVKSITTPIPPVLPDLLAKKPKQLLTGYWIAIPNSYSLKVITTMKNRTQVMNRITFFINIFSAGFH